MLHPVKQSGALAFGYERKAVSRLLPIDETRADHPRYPDFEIFVCHAQVFQGF